MTPVRIIGIGSPFGDDRLGWDVVDALEASGLLSGFAPAWVSANRCDRPGSALLALTQGAEAIILIDAMRTGRAPGTICRLAIHELQAAAGVVSSHGLGVAESLALGQALELLPPTVAIYGIEAQQTAPESGVSLRASAAVPTLLQAIAAELRALESIFHLPQPRRLQEAA